ncbi:MAG: methionine aminotransferase [Kangiellaceae bacterium]|nr:methionine aminotransferase [Kangiellaceae bacterium]MCW8997270.1 methionine aminotransferase [Kangiellaceae bacterium]MCW9017540.1 methionine aminotransferase [Kangiellaceae bacterium]
MSQDYESKLPNVGTSIFTEMSMMANQYGAINLSQGFPEFDTPEFLKSATTQAIDSGANQYAPSAGMPDLLSQIANTVKRIYNMELDSSNITVTSGATEALYVAIQALVRPGDEVIIFDPAYDSYEPSVELAGGKCIHIPMQAPEYRVNWELVKQKVNDNTRLIIINSPHNPTGTILSESDLKQLEKLVIQNELYLISDEVYEFITFDNKVHQSVLRFPKLFERSLVVSSFGKTFHCTGWKLGYCCAPENLTAEFRKIHQFVTFASFTPAQIGTAKMLSENPGHIDELSSFYQKKRDLLAGALASSRFKLLPSLGTYFILADYSDISDKNDVDFCHWLTVEKGVAAIPLSPFYESFPGDKVIRLCFAKSDETLQLAAEKLCQL